MEGKRDLEWWPPAKSHSCTCQGQYLNLAVFFLVYWASLVAQLVKNLPAMLETWVWSLGWEGAMEKGTATHSSIMAWRIPWTEEPGELQSMGSQRVRHDWVTFTFQAISTYFTKFFFQQFFSIIEIEFILVGCKARQVVLCFLMKYDYSTELG